MVISRRRVLLVVIVQLSRHPTRVSTASQPLKHLIERYYHELWNQWRFELIPELLSPDIVFRGSLGVDVKGHDGFRDYMLTVRTAFTDFHNTIEEIITEGNSAAVRLTYRGTHDGALFGVPATGKRILYSGIAIFHFENSLIANGWVLGDTVSLWRQLGVTPPDFRR